MKTRWTLAVMGLVAGTAATAVAAKVGDTLFVKAKNTKVVAKASPTADVVAVLQPGDEVTWQGADKKEKRWHKVSAGGKEGMVFQSNLTTKKPSMEVVGTSGEQVDAKAFASSGAATKALGPGAKQYGEKKNLQDTVAQIEKLEVQAKEVTTKDLAEHSKKNGLFPVVGGDQ
jgi:hypothetical protein